MFCTGGPRLNQVTGGAIVLLDLLCLSLQVKFMVETSTTWTNESFIGFRIRGQYCKSSHMEPLRMAIFKHLHRAHGENEQLQNRPGNFPSAVSFSSGKQRGETRQMLLHTEEFSNNINLEAIPLNTLTYFWVNIHRLTQCVTHILHK